MKIILFILFFVFLAWIIDVIHSLWYISKYPLTVIVGKCGSGKSTLASKLMYEDTKRGWEVLSDYDVKIPKVKTYNGWEFKKGNFLPKGTKKKGVSLYMDEASTYFLNRNYKNNINDKALDWWKCHRKYRVKITLISQSWEDLDIVIRRLADRYYICSRFIFPTFIMARLVKLRIKVVNNSFDKDGKLKQGGQISEQYYYGSIFQSKLAWLPYWIRKFDSFRS